MKFPKGRPPPGGIPQQPCPPPPGIGKIPVMMAPPTGKNIYCVLSTHFVGIGVHWDPDGRGPGRGITVPCMKSRELCTWCYTHKQRPQFRAYLHGVEQLTGQPAILQISEGAFRANPDIQALQGQLRGRWIEVGRLHERGRNAPAYAKFREGPVRSKLPLAVDVQAYLQRLFGYDAKVFRVMAQPDPLPFQVEFTEEQL